MAKGSIVYYNDVNNPQGLGITLKESTATYNPSGKIASLDGNGDDNAISLHNLALKHNSWEDNGDPEINMIRDSMHYAGTYKGIKADGGLVMM